MNSLCTRLASDNVHVAAMAAVLIGQFTKKDYTNTACSISARLLIVYMLVVFFHRQRQTVVQECTSGMQAMSSCTKDALKHADIHNLVVTCMHDF